MFIVANLINALATVFVLVLTIYWWIVIVKCLLSFVSPDPSNQVVMAIERITDPVLSRIRRVMPFVMQAGFDLSPVVVLLIISFLQQFVGGSLFDLGARLK
jgi:YggT family protein